MTKSEKIFMIDCLLRDVRCNWADDPRPRVKFAMDLCYELGGDFNILGDDCKEFIGWIDAGEKIDGRHFRDEFPYGYENLNKIHGLQFVLSSKREEVRELVEEYITCPEYLFSDVENKEDVHGFLKHIIGVKE